MYLRNRLGCDYHHVCRASALGARFECEYVSGICELKQVYADPFQVSSDAKSDVIESATKEIRLNRRWELIGSEHD
jgi:hypothetical protein